MATVYTFELSDASFAPEAKTDVRASKTIRVRVMSFFILYASFVYIYLGCAYDMPFLY